MEFHMNMKPINILEATMEPATFSIYALGLI